MQNDVLLGYLEIPKLTQTDKILIVLLVLDAPTKPNKIQSVLSDHGIREAKKWNMSQLLKATKHAVSLKDGWTLTSNGKSSLKEKLGIGEVKEAKIITSLRDHLPKIKLTQNREFIEEAIRCFESKCFRAAVVLSWTGAMGVLYDEVIKNHLTTFNRNLMAKFPKSKTIVSFDDLALLSENDFLELAYSSSVIDKNVKMHLQNTGLKLRNSCGHPNTFKVSEHQVQAHIELIMLNVFEKF
ncbi:MAG: hypothetical protein NDI63_14920 [Pseudobdellovibrio sp.]|nr:hypothetical protein [Pseudobdellovibrio sp.]